MLLPRQLTPALRLLLSHYVLNGLAVACGLGLMTLLVASLAGLNAVLSASVGMLVVSVTDVTAAPRGKWRLMSPAVVLGSVLWLAIQLTHQSALAMGLVVTVGGFCAMLAMSWGKRGGPVSFALVFAMVLSMATVPPTGMGQALERTAWFALGACLDAAWAQLCAWALNRRYRAQVLADALAGMADLLHTQAARFAPGADHRGQMATVLRQQATLADRLQTARDLLLDVPRSPRDEQLAAMLYGLLEARDQLLACELDLDLVHADALSTAVLPHLQAVMSDTAAVLDRLADALLLGRRPDASGLDAKARLHAALEAMEPSAAAATGGQARVLLRNIVRRVGVVATEVVQLQELARGERRADLAAQAAHWGLYVTSSSWPLQALRNQMSGRSPVLRYAVRLALALDLGYVVALHLPWAAHKHWILLTIAVVMRINLAQTLERRNARVGGTLLGCLIAAALLALHPAVPAIFAVIVLSTAIAHAFVLPHYLIAAVAATLTGLMQSHLLIAGDFAVMERLADTVLGAVLAWACSYVLPAWERRQLPSLVSRVLRAQAAHAAQALALREPQAPDASWRLARREAYDSLSALTQAAQRALAEPRAVQPPLRAVEALQLRSYRLLTHLSSVKSMLTQRRAELDLARVTPVLETTAAAIAQALRPGTAAETPRASGTDDAFLEPAGDAAPPTSTELTPWLLRRLHLTCLEASELAHDASVLQGRF